MSKTEPSSSSESSPLLAALFHLHESGVVPTDCVLVCRGGKDLPCHALVLSALSPVLRAALEPERFLEGTTRRFDLSDFDAALIERALAWAHGVPGAFDGDDVREDAGELMALADRLGWDDLLSEAASILRSRLTSENAAVVLECAVRFGREELAAEARDLVENGGVAVVSKLMKCRVDIQTNVERWSKEIHERKALVAKAEMGMQELAERISFETNKAAREVAETHTKSSPVRDSAFPSYPYKHKRRLVVRSFASDDDDEFSCIRKRKRSDIAKSEIPVLHFDSHVEALQAAKVGDRIELHPGYYGDEILDERKNVSLFALPKSVEICGIGDPTKIVLGLRRHPNPSSLDRIDIDTPVDFIDRGEIDFVLHVKRGADVKFSNLTINGTGAHFNLVLVTDNSRLWLDHCNIDLQSSPVSIGSSASAYISSCKFRGKPMSDSEGKPVSPGCEGHAIMIDPEADQVVVSNCFITGTCVGQSGDMVVWKPGDVGAIEIASVTSQTDEPSSTVTTSLQLQIQDNVITGCHGQAFSYTSYSQTALDCVKKCVIVGNRIENNALALKGVETVDTFVESLEDHL